MGLRYLFLGLALWGVYLIIRHLMRQPKPQQPAARQSKAVDSVQCAHCGLHLPREEALRKGDAYYCSKAHLQASDSQRES
jgi:uncharacterized protein